METGYKQTYYDLGNGIIEFEEKHTGRYGARGQKRKRKEKPTKEEVKRFNQARREDHVRRLILMNFKKGDWWCTKTYARESRPEDWQEMQGQTQKFFRRLAAWYKKQGVPLKYIYRLQKGRNGAAHIHFLINKVPGCDDEIQRLWPFGRVKFEHYAGGYQDAAKVAAYIVTPLAEWEPEQMKRYVTSRNLAQPVAKERIIHRRTLLDKQGNVKEPKGKKGYYVYKPGVRMGINPYTGWAYRRYAQVKLDRRI